MSPEGGGIHIPDFWLRPNETILVKNSRKVGALEVMVMTDRAYQWQSIPDESLKAAARFGIFQDTLRFCRERVAWREAHP